MSDRTLQKYDDAQNVIAKPVFAVLRKHKSLIESIAKGVLTEDRVFRLINAAVTRSPALLQCSPVSVLNAILHITYLGLEIAPEQAYLIPFKDKKTGKLVCTPVIDYRGKIRIAAAAEILIDDPEIVYTEDKFKRWADEKGKHFIHEPKDSERGEPFGAYLLARWHDMVRFTYVEGSEILKIKAAAMSRNATGPWKEHEMEMWKKTVVHRAFKTLPRPTSHAQADVMRRSQELDDALEMGEPVEQLIEGDFEDERPFLPEGSLQQQERVVEEKLNGENFRTVTGPVDAGHTPGFIGDKTTPEKPLSTQENRRLDEQLAREERKTEAARAERSEGPRQGFSFGRKRP